MENKRQVESEQSIAALLGSSDWLVHSYSEITSTMDGARALLDNLHNQQNAIVITDRQSAGRGRLGRSWQQSGGSLFVTYVFSTKAPVASLAGFSLAVGLGLRQTLRRLNFDVFLKWPNDLLTRDGKKLGGILIEVVSRENINYVLCGIGVNISVNPEGVEGAAALSDLNADVPSPGRLCTLLAPELLQIFNDLIQNGFSSFRQEWLKSALYLNKPVKVKLGEKEISGIFEDIDETGSLILLNGEKKEIITAGDVSTT